MNFFQKLFQNPFKLIWEMYEAHLFFENLQSDNAEYGKHRKTWERNWYILSVQMMFLVLLIAIITFVVLFVNTAVNIIENPGIPT